MVQHDSGGSTRQIQMITVLHRGFSPDPKRDLVIYVQPLIKEMIPSCSEQPASPSDNLICEIQLLENRSIYSDFITQQLFAN